VSCAKTAGPTETQFGLLSRVGPGNMYYIGCRCPHGQTKCTFGVSNRQKSIATHGLLGDG